MTRGAADSIALNAVANALLDRFGFVPLSVRYGIAEEALRAGKAWAETVPIDQVTPASRASAEG